MKKLFICNSFNQPMCMQPLVFLTTYGFRLIVNLRWMDWLLCCCTSILVEDDWWRFCVETATSSSFDKVTLKNKYVILFEFLFFISSSLQLRPFLAYQTLLFSGNKCFLCSFVFFSYTFLCIFLCNLCIFILFFSLYACKPKWQGTNHN